MKVKLPHPAAEKALRLLLERLNVEVSPEERRSLAKLLDAELGFSAMLDRMDTVEGLVAQIEKHLDPYAGLSVKLWKRIFIDEMMLHTREARRLLSTLRDGAATDAD
jgi:hypothetical protein